MTDLLLRMKVQFRKVRAIRRRQGVGQFRIGVRVIKNVHTDESSTVLLVAGADFEGQSGLRCCCERNEF